MLIEGLIKILGGGRETTKKEKPATASDVYAAQQRAFIGQKLAREETRRRKEMPKETYQQKQMREYYAAVSKQIEAYDLLNDKKRKYLYDKMVQEHAAYFKRHSIDPHGQNLVLDKLATSVLVPNQEVTEDPQTTVRPTRIGT